MNLVNKVGSIIFLLVILTGTTGASTTLGVSPSSIEMKNIGPGAEFGHSIILTTSEDMGTLNQQKDGSANWISSMVVKSISPEEYEVKLNFDIPDAVAPGSYPGSLTFSTDPQIKNQINTAIAISTHFLIEVVDAAVSDHEVFGVDVQDTQSGYQLLISILNAGNQELSITNLRYVCMDHKMKPVVAPGIINLEQSVSPYERTTLSYPLEFNLDYGQYWLNVSFNVGGVLHSELVAFDVQIGKDTSNIKRFISHLLRLLVR